MAVRVKERPNSNAGRIGRDGADLTRIFRVSGIADPFAALLAVDSVNGTRIPEVLDPHPSRPTFLMADYAWSPVDGGVNTWDIICIYEGADTSSGGGGANIPWVRPVIDRTAQPQPIWRIPTEASPFEFPGGTSSPTQGSAGDIGGLGVDSSGKPVDLPFVVHRMTVSYETLLPIPEGIIWRMQRRRNSQRFHIYPPGSLVYLGAQTEPTGSVRMRITHHFQADELYHLRQRVVEGTDGIPLVATEDSKALYVNWWQPFPLKAPFSLLGIPAISYSGR